LRELLVRTHRNVAILALASKLARIAWAVHRGPEGFNIRHGIAGAEVVTAGEDLREGRGDGLTVDRRSGRVGSKMAP
jgi:hypothetical protein